MRIEEAIKKLKEYHLLSEEMESVMEEIMSGKVNTSLIISFLMAINKQGITSEELAGAAKVMRDKMLRIKSRHKVILDTCGTGGDRKHTFNISTAAAFVAAGAGMAVAKHGNRSVSSKCGSADVLEELGVDIGMKPQIAQKCLDEVGITFLFAPIYHMAMKFAMPARKEIAEQTGEKTIFNFLGPLSNPAGATHQLIGVPNTEYAQIYAQALVKLNNSLTQHHALVVCGQDHMDEITTRVGAPTQVYEIRAGKIEEKIIKAKDFVIESKSGGVKGGTAQENARILIEILENKEKGAYRDIVLLNAGAAIYLAQTKPAGFLKEGISEGIKLARESIESGKALEKLELLKEYSQR